MKGKNLFKSCLSLLTAVATAVTLTISPLTLSDTSAVLSDTDSIFFKASQESSDSFKSDVVYEKLTGNNLQLVTPADAFITPDGYLQINYKSSASAADDGSYTVWGEGGNNNGGNAGYINFKLKASQPDFASQFSVAFYSSGNNIANYNFNDWLTSAGYSQKEIESAVGDFKTFSLPITQNNAGNYQGMKIKFNKGNSTGTIYFDSITFNNGIVFDNFDFTTSRGNYYQDTNGNLPMYRPETSLNGAYAGLNYSSNMMWSASTMLSNIVNNSSSNKRALQISYNTNYQSFAELKSSKKISGESLLALTIKGDASANNCMKIAFIQNETTVKLISAADFITRPGSSQSAMITDNYSTIYCTIPTGTDFDSIRFVFEGKNDINGNVYISEIYFPRYSYTEEHYFDGILNSTFTKTHDGLKFGESLDGKYTSHSNDVFSVKNVVYPDSSKAITGNSDKVQVYYESGVGYTINYYYDNQLDSDKTVNGSGKIGADVSYTHNNIDGYKFDHASADSIKLNSDSTQNIINVYYVKDSFGYTINYYYDGIKDDSKTVSDKAEFKSVVAYEDKNIDGYRFDHASAENIEIGTDASKNIIDVYYVKVPVETTTNPETTTVPETTTEPATTTAPETTEPETTTEPEESLAEPVTTSFVKDEKTTTKAPASATAGTSSTSPVTGYSKVIAMLITALAIDLLVMAGLIISAKRKKEYLK